MSESLQNYDYDKRLLIAKNHQIRIPWASLASTILPEIFFVKLDLSLYIKNINCWMINFETAVYVLQTFLSCQSRIHQSM